MALTNDHLLTRFSLWKYALVMGLLIKGTQMVQWENPEMENTVVETCAGEDVILPWNVTSDSGETIDDVKWTYKGDHSEEVIAFFAHGMFVVTPAFSNRVEFLPNAGLVLKKAGVGDSGNYTVEVIVKHNGRDVASIAGEAVVLVAEQPQAADDRLHVLQEQRAVKDDQGHWTVQLTCGTLTYLGDPSVADAVEWVTPSGEVKRPSREFTSGSNGTKFTLLLPTPVQGGSYVCRLPSQHPSVSCLAGNSSLRQGQAVFVDEMEARLSLIEAEQGALKNENSALKRENDLLTDLNTNLTQRISSLETARAQDKVDLTEKVDELRAAMLMDYSNVTNNLHLVEEALGQCSCQQNRAQRMGFQAQLGANREVGDGQTLVLPDVVLNEGRVYSAATGVFTAPHNATYLFLLTTGAATAGKAARLYMVANGRPVGYASAHYASSYGDTGSGHSVLRLARGDRVWLRSNGESSFWGAATSFTGVLLSLDEYA